MSSQNQSPVSNSLEEHLSLTIAALEQARQLLASLDSTYEGEMSPSLQESVRFLLAQIPEDASSSLSQSVSSDESEDMGPESGALSILEGINPGAPVPPPAIVTNSTGLFDDIPQAFAHGSNPLPHDFAPSYEPQPGPKLFDFALVELDTGEPEQPAGMPELQIIFTPDPVICPERGQTIDLFSNGAANVRDSTPKDTAKRRPATSSAQATTPVASSSGTARATSPSAASTSASASGIGPGPSRNGGPNTAASIAAPHARVGASPPTGASSSRAAQPSAPAPASQTASTPTGTGPSSSASAPKTSPPTQSRAPLVSSSTSSASASQPATAPRTSSARPSNAAASSSGASSSATSSSSSSPAPSASSSSSAASSSSSSAVPRASSSTGGRRVHAPLARMNSFYGEDDPNAHWKVYEHEGKKYVGTRTPPPSPPRYKKGGLARMPSFIDETDVIPMNWKPEYGPRRFPDNWFPPTMPVAESSSSSSSSDDDDAASTISSSSSKRPRDDDDDDDEAESSRPTQRARLDEDKTEAEAETSSAPSSGLSLLDSMLKGLKDAMKRV